MTLMFIGGEWKAAKSGSTYPIINPANEEVVDEVPLAGLEDVEEAVLAAKAAFPSWAKLDFEERGNILRKGIAILEANREEIVQTLVKEQGKPLHEAQGEFEHLLHGLSYYADLATKIRGSYQPLPSRLGPSYGLVIKRPIGVTVAIVPWNFPLTLMGTKIGPALIAGNTVIVKPASTTPLAATKVVGYLNQAGLPPGVLNIITGPGKVVGEALVSHPDVRRVAFTGETSTGRRVLELSVPHFKRVTLELGGSDPVIICPDANLEKAVRGVLIGRFWNAGQACLAAKRVYVFEEIYDDFVERLLAGVSRYEPGEGWVKAERPKIRLGPLHTAKQREEVQAQLRDALSKGGKLLYGGKIPEGREKGFFFEPTVVAEPSHDSRVVKEETFGPLLPIWKVKDIDEAIRLANDSIYGLGSSIWTYNIKWIHKASQEIEAGMTWVNQIHYGYDELPFGGVKQSGYGKEHGLEALEYYFETKSVVIGDLE